MRKHVEDVANAILDTAGDAIFQQYLAIRANIHRYSIGNLMLQMWQAPDSRLVASRSAFGNMAKAQGHTGKSKTSKKGKSWEEFVFVAGGSNAVWIWGAPRPCTSLREVTDAATNEVSKVPVTFNRYFPTDTYCVESIRYCDTDEPFVIPTFAAPVYDRGLYDALLAFAEDKGLPVRDENLYGPLGVSHSDGSIGMQKGTPWEERVGTLLHEIAHSLLHGEKERADLPREVLEGEAAATEATLLTAFGHPIEATCAYLRNWSATPQLVLASMGRISKVACEVFDFVNDRLVEVDDVEVAAEM
jgi:hypothetical protein